MENKIKHVCRPASGKKIGGEYLVVLGLLAFIIAICPPREITIRW